MSKTFPVEIIHMKQWSCKEVDKQGQGWKHKTTLLQKSRGKEILEDYSTTVVWHSYQEIW